MYELVINIGFIGLLLAIFLVSDYSWTTIHEFAHLIAAKLIFGVSEWEMKVRPCKLDGRKVDGYVKYWTIKPLTDKGQAVVSLAPAPFIISILTCILLPICVTEGYYILVPIMWAGVLDQMGGSTVKSDIFWDLPSASKGLGIPFWRMRMYSLSIVFASVLVSALSLGINIGTSIL